MQNRVILILGVKGSGKSYLANTLSKDTEINPKIVICDPLDEYIGGHVYDNIYDFRGDFPRLYYRPEFRAVCKFTVDEYYNQLFTFLFGFRQFTLMVDECDMFARHNSILQSFRRFLSYGRHREIDLILMSRRPYDLHALVRSQADEIITFQQKEPRDLDYIRSMGFDEKAVFNLNFEEHEYLVQQNR